MVRCDMTSERPSTSAQLRSAVAGGGVPRRSVRDEVRDNLIARLRSKQDIFPGIIGYDETVVPQIVNAVLSQHNFILLGLARPGEDAASSARSSTLLDEAIPVMPGCEINDDPLAPLCAPAAHGSRQKATHANRLARRATRATSRSWRRRTSRSRT